MTRAIPITATIALMMFAAAAPAADFGTLEQWLAARADAPRDGLAPADYGQAQLSDLAAYLPPGTLELFDFPELSLTIEPSATYAPHPVYAAATARFAGQATLDGDGHMLNYTAGQPFSAAQIRAADATAAGYMAAWNQIRRWQNHGYRNESIVTFIQPTADGSSGELLEGMLGGGHVERHVGMFYHRVYLSGVATLADSDYRLDVDGSDELLFKEYIEMLSPFDIAGLKIVVERPLDQSQGDQVNSYLPTERRVRRLSAKERADSWIGTNWTLDDFEGYSGLVMDNTWRLLGEKVVLHVASTRNELTQYHGPMSTIPLDDWQLRPCWVAEAVPRWEGHPYGRRVLFIDQETGSVTQVQVYDRNDQLLKVFMTVYAYSDDLDNPEPAMSTPRWQSSIAMNVQDGSANFARSSTMTEFVEMKPSQVRKLFSVSNLGSGR